MTTAIRRSIAPADPIDARIFEPVSKENGITLLKNGVIYSFDDWEGTDILTGSNAWPIPYKKSLSNIFTGFEAVKYFGNSTSIDLKPLSYGLNWFKSVASAQSNAIIDFIRNNYLWESNTTIAQVGLNPINGPDHKENGIRIGNDARFNSFNENMISWHWYYPLAKAWHPNGAASRKVPTPYGIVDSVEANASSGLSTNDIIIELYNPLTGNGCLLYRGNGANRTLDISGGKIPQFLFTKLLSTTSDSRTYHSQLNGGTNPYTYSVILSGTTVESSQPTYWNSAPTASNIGLGTFAETNSNNGLLVLYYFSSVAGLQNFGGYAGNSDKNDQDTGCKDGLIFIKIRTGTAGDWCIYDSIRGDSNALYWSQGAAQGTLATVSFNATSGFDLDSNSSQINESGRNYIYGHFGAELKPQGEFDIYPTTAITSSGNNNKTKIIFEYKGAGNLNSDILLYASRKSLTINWALGSMIKTADLSDGYEQIEAEIDLSAITNNNEMRWRLASNEGTFTEHNFKNLKMVWYS